MKKLRISIVLTALLSLASCAKEGNALFRGDYSFKTSGTVLVNATIKTSEETQEKDFDLFLDTEQGQMDVVTKGEDLLVVFNVLGGDVFATEARAEADSISLEPFSRKVKMHFKNIGSVDVPIQVSGEGHRYENTLVFDLKYEGESDINISGSDIHFLITSSDIKCVAKLNE